MATTGTGYGTTGVPSSTGSGSYILYNISAEFIKDKDFFGQQDPYCIFELGDESVHTKVVKEGGVNPVWDEEYTLAGNASAFANELKVFAYNKNTLLPDQLLGHGVLPVRSLGSEQTQRVPLTNKRGQNTGQLIFKVRQLGGKSQGTSDVRSTGADLKTGVTTAATTTHQTATVVPVMPATTTAAVTGSRPTPGGLTGAATHTVQTSAAVCDTKHFTRIEDRPVVIEKKEYVLEHHPYEKEFVVETKATGREREVHSGVPAAEHLRTEERVVSQAQTSPCAGAPEIGNAVVAGITQQTTGYQQNTGYTTGPQGYNQSGAGKPGIVQQAKQAVQGAREGMAGERGPHSEQAGYGTDNRSLAQKAKDAVTGAKEVVTGHHGQTGQGQTGGYGQTQY